MLNSSAIQRKYSPSFKITTIFVNKLNIPIIEKNIDFGKKLGHLINPCHHMGNKIGVIAYEPVSHTVRPTYHFQLSLCFQLSFRLFLVFIHFLKPRNLCFVFIKIYRKLSKILCKNNLKKFVIKKSFW